MGSHHQQERLESIFQAVEQQPGQRPAEIADQLGLNRSEVTRYLPLLEENGLLLSEDKRGRLYPFSPKKSETKS